MSNFFFTQLDQQIAFTEALKSYAEKNHEQIYVIHSPLGDNKYTYDYQNALVVLSPKRKISFIDLGSDENNFEEYVDEFVEDLGYISDKYKYKFTIGRPKKWKGRLTTTFESPPDDIEKFFGDIAIENSQDQKFSQLIISLLTGSINDIEAVQGDVPLTLLDKVKCQDPPVHKFFFEIILVFHCTIFSVFVWAFDGLNSAE